MSLIQTLPLEVIKLIAAGEVIDSLAAVVRELVENAIDADANRIVIAVFPDLWQIQVSDNGKGMSLDDLHQCVNPHSTSKISHKNDLWRIKSLGFRGEALHSIAQVADLEIMSRQAEDEIGWQVGYQQGEIIKTNPLAIAPGTVVTVKNLFGRIPVRRQALPSLKTQTKAIQQLVGDIALAHPQITWQAWKDRKPWFNISPSSQAKDILTQLVKQIQPSDLHAIEQNLNPPQTQNNVQIQTACLQLTVGLPDRCHRRRNDWVKIAVNGRVVRSPALERTIIVGFTKTLRRDRFPVCFAHLNLCPTQIDWNRHPAKSEIYLHHLDWWGEQISLGIEQALRFNSTTVATTVANRRVEKLIKAAEDGGKYQVNTPETDLLSLKAVAQVNKTYIVAEHPQGIWLVEQHIAHERVIYEQIQHNWELVPLEVPIILNNLTTAQQEQLQRIGIELEEFGQQMWAVRTIPAILQQRQDCEEAIAELSLADDLTSAQVAVACRSAIRNGTALELDWMQKLLQQWQQTKNPHTCPHGRPIYLSLEETSLSRFFRRHWVVGKSHGI